MPNVIIPTWQDPMIQPAKHAQNAKFVRTTVESLMRREANQIRAHRGREQFCSPGRTRAILTSGGAGARDRWRYYTHTGPHTTRVRVRMRIAPQNSGSASTPHCRFRLASASGTSVIGEFVAFYGSSGSGTTGTPDTWGVFDGEIAVPADTDLQGVFTDFDGARLVSALAYEDGPPHDTANGYLGAAPAQGANLFDLHREEPVTFANAAWRRGGTQVFNFCHDDDTDFVRVSFADANIVDRTSTTISAATPGFTLDLTGKALFRQSSGVPCVLAVLGSCNQANAAKVRLKDSSGATLATVFLPTTIGWQTTAVTLPATSAKYDVHFSSNGTASGLFRAVSCFELM